MANDQYIPASPRNISIRPLDKGVVNNLSPGMVPKGGFLKIRDFQVSPSGLEQRPGYITPMGDSSFVDFEPIRGFQEFWSTAGVKRTLLNDRKFFYEVEKSGTGFVASKLASTGFASTTETVTITQGSDTTDYVKVEAGGFTWDPGTSYKQGDVIVVSINGTTEQRVLSQFVDTNDDNTIDYATVQTGFSAGTSGESFKIEEGLYEGGLVSIDIYGTDRQLGHVVFPDAVSIPGKTIVTDGLRIPKVYDGSTWEAFTTQEMVPVCVGYFRDRLFFGQMRDSSDNYYRQRIRWSEAGNFNKLPETSYIDLPYQKGAVWRIVPFAQGLVAFFDDAVYMGRPTSSSSLPVYFEKIETGGIGLVGMRAITFWMDSIFFTGQDDIYMVTAEEVKPVGTRAVKKFIKKLGSNQKGHIMGYRNTHEGKIGFAMPGDPEGDKEDRSQLNAGDLNVLWELDVASGAWSKLTFGGNNIGFIQEGSFSTAISIDDFEGETYDDYSSGAIDNYTSLLGDKRLYFDKGDGVLAAFDYEGQGGGDYPANPDGGNIPSHFETGDIDLDSPDGKKLFNRIGIKLNNQISNDATIEFDIKVSSDRGQHWKPIGRLKIAGGTDEGKLNFQLVGSAIRVYAKLMVNTHGRFEMGEITMRAKPRGREVRFD